MTPEQQQQLNEVYEFVQSLKRSSSIPREIDQSFRDRFLKTVSSLSTSSKSASSENQAVNEGGAATYSVLKVPDAFLQVNVGSTTYYIPVFT